MSTQHNVAESSTINAEESARLSAALSYWGVVYSILVSQAGARETDRDCFVDYFSKQNGSEWRFCGSLGFGGKCFTSGRGRAIVSCYPEDRTPQRDDTIAMIMTLLAVSPYDRWSHLPKGQV